MDNEEIPKDNIEQAVFNALKKETGFELSPGFADRLVGIMERRAEQKEARRDRWWLVAGLFSMVIALVYAAVAVDFSLEIGNFFSGYSGLVIFGLFFVAAIHLFDKFILSKNRVDQ
jgi:hypothetical protein